MWLIDQCVRDKLFDGDIFSIITREAMSTGSQARVRSKYLSEADLKKAELLIYRAFLFSSFKVIISKIKEKKNKLNIAYLWSKFKFFFLNR